VLVRPDTLVRFIELFEADPDLDAAFGSYDLHPEAPGLVSQYRNLLHHFVHQTGREAASSFWAGCGAMRRNRFLALGGFNPSYTRPSIEDIELGYRLHAHGGRIRLAKQIQVTHLKRWTFWGMLHTDVWDRALPWTTLILRSRHLPNDLNLQTAHRLSALSMLALAVILSVGWWLPLAWLAAPPALAVLLFCNRTLYAFFLEHRGVWFLSRAVPLHVLYYTYSSLAFAYGVAFTALRRREPTALQSGLGLTPESTELE
jgi:hypothetical protein